VPKPSASPPEGKRAALLPAFGKLVSAAAGLPGIVEGTSYGTPSLQVGRKFLCRVKDPETIVLMCPLEEKEMLLEAAPDVYFETDHYRGWPAILVRIERIAPAELRHRLRRAYLMQAPAKLAKQLEAGK
jgi:hypothetical protein